MTAYQYDKHITNTRVSEGNPHGTGEGVSVTGGNLEDLFSFSFCRTRNG